MNADQAQGILLTVRHYYDSIPLPKYRHADLNTLIEKFDQLQGLKDDLGHEQAYLKLINAMSQIIVKLSKPIELAKLPKDKIWSNLSERGSNKVIPPIIKGKVNSWPVQWTDKWGNASSVSNGYWNVRNQTVLDVIGYMFLLNEGGDCLPKHSSPLFSDLFEIEQLESHLNGGVVSMMIPHKRHYIRFSDADFRRFTGLKMNSTEIKDLLHETSRVEFKLTFPVRLKDTGAKENTHHMNYYSRFFEFAHEDLSVKKNGIVMSRRYTIVFNTLLGELFVNNLLAKFNDPIDIRFYQLPDSAQLFYRRALIHHSFKNSEFNLSTIAEYAGLTDSNLWNLSSTVEKNILQPLIDYGYILSFERVGQEPKSWKYIIKRTAPNNKEQ